MDQIDPGLVQVGVVLGLSDRLLVKIHAGHVFGIASKLGVEAKSARVRADIKDQPVCAKICQSEPVFALVAEKTSLVGAFEFHAVADTVLMDAAGRW